MLDLGFGSITVETAGGAIFRIARTEAAAAGHALEMRLLPAVGPTLLVAVPQPRWRVEPGDADLPYGAIGYDRLPGRPLAPGDVPPGVAVGLAGFLARLHGFPVAQAERLDVPRAQRPADRLRRLRANVLPALRERLDADELASVSAWWSDVEDDRDLDRFSPSLVHDDLWYAHVLVDGEPPRVAAVLDWEAAAIGDPARDLAAQLHLGDEFARGVLDAYPSRDGGLAHRVRRHWELRELGGLAWALEQDDPEELEDALHKLRRGPILTPREDATM